MGEDHGIDEAEPGSDAGGEEQGKPGEDLDAELAGAIRADLECVGKPIGAYDLLIAGQAMRNKLTLITASLSEFARIKALAWADWGKPVIVCR